MRPPRNPLPVPVENPREEKRRHGRLKAELLSCPLGQVLDISASGIRVLVKGRLRVQTGDDLEFELKTVEQSVPVKVRVTRAHQLGWRRFELGMAFRDVTPATAAAISALGRYTAAAADRSYPH